MVKEKMTGWCIKGPRGGLLMNTWKSGVGKGTAYRIFKNPQSAKKEFCFRKTYCGKFEKWNFWHNKGYRCIKVNIEELKNENN